MPSQKRFSKLLATAMAMALFTAPAAAALQDKVNARGALVKAFLERVDDYVAVHKKAAEGLPRLSPTDEPSKLEAYQAALTARIKLARQHAKAGDIFGEATPLFRAVIRKDTADRTRKETRSAAEGIPKRDPIGINVPYPEKVPVATMPPLMLGEFPPLPDGLEYRLLGDDLILYDTKANLIVDLIRGAGAPITEK